MRYEEGNFVYTPMLTGKAIVRVEKLPAGLLPKLGSATGFFDFDADPIPAQLMGQVVDFFTRIYNYQHTEAAVLLTMHEDTKQWRIYVPTQRVSHGGVDYVFDPATIRRPWIKVGSIHSHCDFGAGHSGTDTTDADGFNGLHMTIGFIRREVPQIVAMGSVHGKNFHYKPESFDDLFDFSEVRKHPAPDWWFRYVEDPKQKIPPVGEELYKKFPKKPDTLITKVEGKESGPTKHNSYTESYNDKNEHIAADWEWNQNAKRMVHKTWQVFTNGDVRTSTGTVLRKGEVWTGPTHAFPKPKPQPLTQSNHTGLTVIHRGTRQDSPTDRNFAKKVRLSKAEQQWLEQLSIADLIDLGFDWDAADHEWVFTGNAAERQAVKDFSKLETVQRIDSESITDSLSRYNDDFWEDKLGKDLVDALFAGDQLSDDEITFAVENQNIAGDPLFWRQLFMKKIAYAQMVLKATGMDIKLDVKLPPPSEDNTPLLPAGLDE